MVKSLRVVIADDSARSQMFVATSLRRAKHEVVGIAGTGVDAVTLCRQHHPDLAILDIAMPKMNGLEAARIMLAEGLVSYVLIVSSNMQAGFIKQARIVGAKIIGKTNDGAQLMAEIARLIPGAVDGT